MSFAKIKYHIFNFDEQCVFFFQVTINLYKRTVYLDIRKHSSMILKSNITL